MLGQRTMMSGRIVKRGIQLLVLTTETLQIVLVFVGNEDNNAETFFFSHSLILRLSHSHFHSFFFALDFPSSVCFWQNGNFQRTEFGTTSWHLTVGLSGNSWQDWLARPMKFIAQILIFLPLLGSAIDLVSTPSLLLTAPAEAQYRTQSLSRGGVQGSTWWF